MTVMSVTTVSNHRVVSSNLMTVMSVTTGLFLMTVMSVTTGVVSNDSNVSHHWVGSNDSNASHIAFMKFLINFIINN